MLYRFRSKASADVLMLEAQGDALLRAIGREPAAAGIIEVAAMPAAMSRLRESIEEDEQARSRMSDDDGHQDAAAQAAGLDPVSARRRWWPMVEMLRRCHAEDAVIVWGV
jgi:Domain of unknown function (DUF1840)